jgi:hypothetical protein
VTRRMDDVVVFPWDTLGLPPRRFADRCANHPPHSNGGVAAGGCAFRDDDPARCPYCHRRSEGCAAEPCRAALQANLST